MLPYMHFPTTFATSLLRTVKLYAEGDIYDNKREDADEAAELHGRLGEFQKLSLFSSFDAALVAYHDLDLDEDQLAALTLVHSSSKTWALGHVATVLLTRLEEDPKQLSNIADTLLEQLETASEGNGGRTTERVKRFVVNMHQAKKGDVVK